MAHLFKDIEDNEDNESHTGKMAHLLTMTAQKITMSVHTGKGSPNQYEDRTKRQ